MTRASVRSSPDHGLAALAPTRAADALPVCSVTHSTLHAHAGGGSRTGDGPPKSCCATTVCNHHLAHAGEHHHWLLQCRPLRARSRRLEGPLPAPNRARTVTSLLGRVPLWAGARRHAPIAPALPMYARYPGASATWSPPASCRKRLPTQGYSVNGMPHDRA
jgi:hypothetical protein